MKNKHQIDSWFFADFSNIDCSINLDKEESEHLIKVFRVKINDNITVSNGVGLVKNALVVEISNKSVKINLLDNVPSQAKPELSIAIGFLKNRDLEDVVDTCCQLNLDNIFILHTDHSQENQKSDHKKLMQRLETKSKTALKQAHKAWLTKIHPVQDYSDWIEQYSGQIIILDPNGSHIVESNSKEQCLLIGPEGGLSTSELELAQHHLSSENFNSQNMTLGNTRIRAKTAGIVALGKLL